MGKPKYPIVGWRIPTDVADELRGIARDEGRNVGEVVADLFRGKRKRYEELRKKNGGRRLGRCRLIGRSVKSVAHLSFRRNAG